MYWGQAKESHFPQEALWNNAYQSLEATQDPDKYRGQVLARCGELLRMVIDVSHFQLWMEAKRMAHS